ncbi:hypothetical protein F0562_014840 [Nyssa sinensis]|uniref:Uncharacterized protein n=1 Tax=Nyssa sinensis TaxID=561372 RepID=A0A5J4ZRY2_9ASTE|nr:hypothetical protein F0562_014840 [Nyssa sinensis]
MVGDVNSDGMRIGMVDEGRQWSTVTVGEASLRDIRETRAVVTLLDAQIRLLNLLPLPLRPPHNAGLPHLAPLSHRQPSHYHRRRHQCHQPPFLGSRHDGGRVLERGFGSTDAEKQHDGVNPFGVNSYHAQLPHRRPDDQRQRQKINWVCLWRREPAWVLHISLLLSGILVRRAVH